MTLATLKRLEWTSDRISAGGETYRDDWCPACHALRKKGHAPDCELDAAIREAEQAEKGERPELQAGDWVQSPHQDEVHCVTAGDMDDWARATVAEREEAFREHLREIRGERNGRPFLWRQEPPTHD